MTATGDHGVTMMLAPKLVGQDNKLGQGHVTILMEGKIVKGTELRQETATPLDAVGIYAHVIDKLQVIKLTQH